VVESKLIGETQTSNNQPEQNRMDRFASIRMTGTSELMVCEVHETSQDGRDWLSQVIKFTNREWPNVQHSVLSAFSKTSRCAVVDCDRLVEVGAHLTFDGKQLLIVPCCKTHNAVGNLDKLGRHARLKPYQLYAEINVKPGYVFEDKEGKYYLTQALPSLLDE